MMHLKHTFQNMKTNTGAIAIDMGFLSPIDSLLVDYINNDPVISGKLHGEKITVNHIASYGPINETISLLKDNCVLRVDCIELYKFMEKDNYVDKLSFSSDAKDMLTYLSRIAPLYLLPIKLEGVNTPAMTERYISIIRKSSTLAIKPIYETTNEEIVENFPQINLFMKINLPSVLDLVDNYGKKVIMRNARHNQFIWEGPYSDYNVLTSKELKQKVYDSILSEKKNSHLYRANDLSEIVDVLRMV